MKRATISEILLTLLLTTILTTAFNIHSVKAEGTIYIRADGSVEGTDKIQQIGNIYSFTDNINDSIVIERNDIVVDGKGHTLEGQTTFSTGISVSAVSNVTVKDTNIKGFSSGIMLEGSSGNNIYGNNITNNGYGIAITDSLGYNISRNNFVDDGLVLWDFIVPEPSANVVSENWVNGKPLVYLEGVADYVVQDAGQVILVNCNRIRVENLNLSAASVGVELLNTDNSVISGNTITRNECGIYVEVYSSQNSLSGNTITENGGGIEVNFGAGYTNISGNTITENRGGITLHYSSYNNVGQNIITANHGDGIWVMLSDFNNINGNTIAGNKGGIGFAQTAGNNVTENTITDNVEGIRLGWACWNKIYHNNISHNVHQVSADWDNSWDDGYPSGGNYWSDYNGTDLFGGSYQNLTGSDGIGDTSYVIRANNRDNYPLMKPWVPFVTATVDLKPDSLNVKSGLKLVTAYIELPEIYSPRGIDISTVKLNSTIQAQVKPIAVGDYDGDGILDLMVKFNAADIVPLLQTGVNALTVTGNVNGRPFEGVDRIRVKK